jgi:medium-chain acyl-[acyl-carrier-protein] hydrolase
MPMPLNRYLPTDISPWAEVRLFALPYAGGGAAGYFRWRSALLPTVDVVPIHLPARETRIGEPPIAELRPLVTEIADAVEPTLDRPFALLGHSMGAWLAFELARELRRRGARSPGLLIVAASPAPHRPQQGERLHELPDAEFVEEVSRRFDGIPPAVRANSELLQLLLPALRADLQLIETYEYADEPPLEIDILALGGTEDQAISATALADWRRHTARGFSQRMLPGGHFFLFQAMEPDAAGQSAAGQSAVVRMLAERLARTLDS